MKLIQDAVERRAVWPYAISENSIKAAFQLSVMNGGQEIKNYLGNNFIAGAEGIADAAACVELFGIADSWTSLRIELNLSHLDMDAFRQKVFGNGFQPACLFAVTGSCTATRWRSATQAALSQESAIVVVEIQRDQVAGEVLLQPIIMLNQHLDAPIGRAKKLGSRLATGFPIRILVDEPDNKPGSGLQIKWLHFPEEHALALYFLEMGSIDNPAPILFLNSRHPALEPILNFRGKQGNRAAIRDGMFSFIATDVWTQLARYAVDTNRNDSNGDTPAGVLSTRIIASLAKRIHCSKQEVTTVFEDESAVRRFKTRIQNAMKVAIKQTGVITGLSPVAEASNL